MTETHSAKTNLFIEFTPTSAAIAMGDKTSSVALEHEANGRLTEASRGALKQVISDAVSSGGASTAYCAISARGVSLRKLRLPPTKPEDLRRMLSFQIEKEFPLGPDELAWGFQSIIQSTGGEQPMEVLLVAVKKELVEDYSAVLSELQLSAVFTVGMLADVACLASAGDGPFTVLNVGTAQTEYVLCENGVASTVRVLPAGSSGEMAALAEKLNRLALPDRVFVTAQIAEDADRVKSLEEALSSPERGERLRLRLAPPAIDALRQLVARGDAGKLVALRVGAVEVLVEERTNPFSVKWAAIAAALLFGLLVMRYVEPVVKKPALEAKIAEVNAAREMLPPIEEELEFLRYLEKSRPAYLNAVTVLADAVPRGAKFDHLGLTRQGDFNFRVTLQTQQEATALREKLLGSGLFSRVVLEEQTPSEQQGNKGLSTRISARWIPAPDAPSKTIDRIVAESSAAREKGKL